MNRKSLLILLSLIILIFSMIVGCEKETPQVIGEVNGEKITLEQYNQHYQILKNYYEQQFPIDEKNTDMVNEIKDQSFNELVNQRLVMQQAKKLNIEIAAEQVDKDMENMQAGYEQKAEGGWQKYLQENGFTEKFLREEWTNQRTLLAVQDYVTSDIEVSEEEVENYYNKNRESFKQEAGIQISHILVETESEALDIIGRIKAGDDFSDLARKYSTCNSSQQGGDLGVVNENTTFVEEFKTVALELEPGQYTSKPVRSQFGYHIIKAGNRAEAGYLSLEQARAEIESNLLASKKQQAFSEYLEKLKKEAEIKDFRKR